MSGSIGGGKSAAAWWWLLLLVNIDIALREARYVSLCVARLVLTTFTFLLCVSRLLQSHA